MDELTQDAAGGLALKVRAGLAKPRATTKHVADRAASLDERVEVYPATLDTASDKGALMHGWPISRASIVVVALAVIAALAAIAVLAPRAEAVVPPSDCGRLTVKAKRYTIKADQLRCSTARSHASRYLSKRRKPSGYKCRDFGSETKLRFRCTRGDRVFFAIRR